MGYCGVWIGNINSRLHYIFYEITNESFDLVNWIKDLSLIYL
jgi:hypothetical protein